MGEASFTLVREELLRIIMNAERFQTIDLAWMALLTLRRFEDDFHKEQDHLFPARAARESSDE